MQDLEKHVKELVFDDFIMIKIKGELWGLFSKPYECRSFDWFYTEEKGAWLSIPMKNKNNWIKGRWKKVESLCLPFKDCLKMAIKYNEFLFNSETF